MYWDLVQLLYCWFQIVLQNVLRCTGISTLFDAGHPAYTIYPYTLYPKSFIDRCEHLFSLKLLTMPFPSVSDISKSANEAKQRIYPWNLPRATVPIRDFKKPPNKWSIFSLKGPYSVHLVPNLKNMKIFFFSKRKNA